MSDDLPSRWRWAKLGEICSEDRQGISADNDRYAEMPYLGLEHIESMTGRVLVSKAEAGLVKTRSNNFQFTTDHVLYGKLRPYLNKVALPMFSGRCTTEIIPLLPKGVDRQWLTWLLRRQDTVDYAMLGKTGSRMPRASMRDLMKMSVPVPPIEEQHQMVAQLKTQLAAAERARRAAQAQLDALDAMSAALLREIFPRSPSERLPLGWRWVKLGDICEIVNGSTPKSAVPEYWDGDICWITPTDLGQLATPRIHKSNRYLTQEGYDSCSTKLVPSGAVVLSSRAPIGHLAIAETPLCTNQGCKSLVPTSVINGMFLYYSLKRAVEDVRAMGSGATFAEIGKRVLSTFEIPIPPLQEQTRLVEELEDRTAALEHAHAAAKARLDAANALPAALLRLAFPA